MEQQIHISEAEKRLLANGAKETILNLLHGKSFSFPKSRISENLEQFCGCYILILKNNKIRGSAGEIFSTMPLHQAVIKFARSAAMNDKTYAPLSLTEAQGINVVVNLIHNVEEISSAGDLEYNKHGVCIEKPPFKSCLFPGYYGKKVDDRESLLSGACEAAGLSKNAWRSSDVTVYRFESISFSTY